MSDIRNTFYKTYLELLQEEAFLLWQLSPTEEANEYWADLQQEYPLLEKEIKQAKEYLKKNIFKKRYIKTANKTLLLKRIYESVALRERQKQRRKRLMQTWAAYGAVASLLVLIGFSFLYRDNQEQEQEHITVSQLETKDIQLITGDKTTFFNENVAIQICKEGVAEVKNAGKNNEKEVIITSQNFNKLIVPYGKRSKVELPDGTKVWLNSGSVLEFPSGFDKTKREIRLSGEMYIEVMPDKTKPFQVQTANFKVAVYGTKFNLSAYNSREQHVALLEGSVGIKTGEEEVCRLRPNEIAIYSAEDAFRKQKADASKYISWVNGYVIFEQTPIIEALKYIERYYNLSLHYSDATNLRNKTCNGKLYLSDNLDNVMKSIALLSNTVYEQENNTIYISNSPQ